MFHQLTEAHLEGFVNIVSVELRGQGSNELGNKQIQRRAKVSKTTVSFFIISPSSSHNSNSPPEKNPTFLFNIQSLSLPFHFFLGPD
jgi:hypothetical protein